MPLLDIPAGHLGTVVSFLEMTERPRPRPLPDAPDKYRTLFRRVGGPWLWYSRLAMDDATLLANIAEVHAVVDRRGVEIGMLEVNFRKAGECLVRFLGLVPELAGRGHGKWLFAQLAALAWRPGVGRVHLTTCTLDPCGRSSFLSEGRLSRVPAGV